MEAVESMLRLLGPEDPEDYFDKLAGTYYYYLLLDYLLLTTDY